MQSCVANVGVGKSSILSIYTPLANYNGGEDWQLSVLPDDREFVITPWKIPSRHLQCPPKVYYIS